MTISGTSKTVWLWLRERGGHWTVHEIAQRTGLDADAVFTAVHAMSRARRGLVEQVAPAPGEQRMRYGVTDDCRVPLGLTVREASTGRSKAQPARATPAVSHVPAQARTTDALSASELPYGHLSHCLHRRPA